MLCALFEQMEIGRCIIWSIETVRRQKVLHFPFEFSLTLTFPSLLPVASYYLTKKLAIAWDVVLVARENPMDVKAMVVAARVAVTG